MNGLLDPIGVRLRSDKSSLVHNYLAKYEKIFSKWKNEAITIVEFCDSNTKSLEIWKEYFPKATLILIYPSLPEEAHSYLQHERIIVFEGQQDSDILLRNIALYQRPKIIIDDGRHIWRQQIYTLISLFEWVDSDGVYIIEDTQTFAPSERSRYSGGSPISPADLVHELQAGEKGPTPSPGSHLSSEHRGAVRLLLSCLHSVQNERGFVCFVRNKTALTDLLSVSPAAACSKVFHRSDSGGDYARIEATIVNCPDWLQKRFNLATQDRIERNIPAAGVAVFESAVVHGRGLVISPNGQVVRESLINADHSLTVASFMKIRGGDRYFAYNPPSSVKTAGTEPHVLLKQMWDGNYGHWIIESLPRVGVVAEFFDIQALKFVVQNEPEPMKAVYLESLASFGVSPDQVVFTSFDSVFYPKLIYPLPMTKQPWVKAPRVIATLEVVAKQVAARATQKDLGDKIYIARGSGYRRRLLNEDAIMAVLEAWGFKIYQPEKLRFEEQVAIFSQAKLVVGVLGAGLSNLAFSPKGVQCLALTSEFMGDDFFYDIICHKRGRYVSIHGKAANPSDGMNSDFSIDLDVLNSFLEKISS
ncbi:glycosyltransferase family 61 protein [Paracraurococcus ruber]|uniref:Glycosyltransferase 61 catalytic domain-containing protein n=1 Tax=Paracraurococcus ruber TaxID=77675 RepID=A0ABS1D3U5_9PROT|nr:glycosyltransferase family 61 protein [Paracraurococcus ruber]MBK1661231.1 hypothetical protein [Paracraurococcus ruber]TDG31332.1 glycosyltransferase family 61 protein [Paracraurococcus ruber]